MLAQLFWRWSGTLRILRDARPVEDARAARILEEFGSWRPVSVHVTSTVRAPALCGIWRGRILLPEGWLEELPAAELQSVLLHELGHHRRGDLICEWLFALARCLHWMNPAVWLAERCSRRERELACDGWALERCAYPESYGDALLEALKRVGRLPAPCFGVVPMAHDLRQISTRLEWVSTYRPSPRWRTFLAWMPALAILAAVGSDPLAVNVLESSPPEAHTSAPDPVAQSSPPKEAPAETVAAAPLPPEKKSVEITLDLLRISESTANQLNLPIAADQSNGVQRVLSGPDFKALCARIRQSPDAEFLPAPRLISQSGQKSSAGGIRELRYGAQYKPPTKSGIWVPATIETVKLGMTFEWQADVRADRSVHLEIHPQLNRLIGFQEESGKLTKALAPSAGANWLRRLTACEMPVVGAGGVPSCALQERRRQTGSRLSGEVAMVFWLPRRRSSPEEWPVESGKHDQLFLGADRRFTMKAILFVAACALAAAPVQPLLAQTATPKPASTQQQIEFESKFFTISAGSARRLGLIHLPDEPAKWRGVLAAPEYEDLLRLVAAEKGVDVLSAPRVTTKVDQRAVIEIIREFRYPTEFDLSPVSSAAPKAARTFTPSTFETRNTGVTLEVEGRILPGNRISIVASPRLTEFEGFVSYAGGKTQKAQPTPQPALASRYLISSTWIPALQVSAPARLSSWADFPARNPYW